MITFTVNSWPIRNRGWMVRAVLWEAQDGACFHCGKRMLMSGERRESVSFEHIIPKVHGGKWNRNVVLAHRGCNERRGDRELTPQELRRAAAVLCRATDLIRENNFPWREWLQDSNPVGIGVPPGMEDSKVSVSQQPRLASGQTRGVR